jgi:hypothetical protein
VRILPRPVEAYGQPLTIASREQEGGQSTVLQFSKLISETQGEWCGPTKISPSQYNARATNIFLRIRDEPLPEMTSDEETESYDFPLLPWIGAPDDTPIYAVDPRYLNYFVQELPNLLSIDYLFPNALSCILGMTMGNPALWHAVLALSSYLADNVIGRPTSATYIHLQRSLPLIQAAISNLTIDDSHIAAVFCLAYLCLTMGEIASAGRHLDGLILLLEHREARQTSENALVNAIRRMAIRFDNVRAATGRELAIPTHKLETTIPHREWLAKLIEPDKIGAMDWALAEFELEDLANQILHLNQRAMTLRASPTHNPDTDEHELLFRADVLLDQLRKWKLKPILMAAEAVPTISEIETESDDLPTFLNYPPLQITNFVYAKLMIMYYRLVILASLVIYPQIGPQPPERLEAAISLCQTYAAYRALRPKISSVLVLPMAFAGFVLGEIEHPEGRLVKLKLMVEFEWICRQLTEMETNSGLTAAALAANALRTIWQNPFLPFWDIWFQQTDT